MTSGAIDALRADRDALLKICGGLSDAEWKTNSGCAGWSVQDVVAHMGGLFWAVVDPSTLPDTTGVPTEQAQGLIVESRRSWSIDRVVEDYTAISADAITRLAGLEGQDFELQLGDLGTYPASILPNAFSFDHYTHIRADLFEPRGPLTGTPPPSDELRLVPALDWIVAALPQQNIETVAALPGSVTIELRGVAARTISVGDGEPRARIDSDASSMVRWITQRGAWEDFDVAATGDVQALALARQLRVF